MNQLLSSCLAVGALAGATLAHPTLATASEPVWLTEAEMDRVTAGFELGFEWNGAKWVSLTYLPLSARAAPMIV
jgi:hypothetical protein